jgi:hypothetical protein
MTAGPCARPFSFVAASLVGNWTGFAHLCHSAAGTVSRLFVRDKKR